MEALSTPLRSPLERAVQLAGGQVALAAAIGVSHTAISNWLRLKGGAAPAKHVQAICRAVNGQVKPHELRPDIFPASEAAA